MNAELAFPCIWHRLGLWKGVTLIDDNEMSNTYKKTMMFFYPLLKKSFVLKRYVLKSRVSKNLNIIYIQKQYTLRIS